MKVVDDKHFLSLFKSCLIGLLFVPVYKYQVTFYLNFR